MTKLFVSGALVFESYLSVIERIPAPPTRERPEITDHKVKLYSGTIVTFPNKVPEAVRTGTCPAEPEIAYSFVGVNFLNNVFDVNLRIWLWETKCGNDHRTAFVRLVGIRSGCLDGQWELHQWFSSLMASILNNSFSIS
jgi:hypothetical protein